MFVTEEDLEIRAPDGANEFAQCECQLVGVASVERTQRLVADHLGDVATALQRIFADVGDEEFRSERHLWVDLVAGEQSVCRGAGDA